MMWFWKAIAAGACLTGAVACSNRAQQPANSAAPAVSAQPAQSAAQALPAETNPPGDIPDTQVFVQYRSRSGHYSLEYPEGWQRTEHAGNATFTHDFDGERLRLIAQPVTTRLAIAPFSVVRDVHVTSARLPAGTATLVSFTSNSAPNGVTGKRVRLSNNTYIISSRAGTVFLDLWAPLGSDNVDQWHRISHSFQWK